MIRTPPPWLVAQRWERFLFAHWPVEPAELERLLPPGVDPDERDGAGWLSIVAFVMVGTRSCGPPWWPVLAPIPELNVRTYVRVHGEPAVWFLSLDATSTVFASVGRALYGMPYRISPMFASVEGDVVRYRCERRGAEFVAAYRPLGPACRAEPGSLEHFLVERYRLFSQRRGRLVTAEVAHEPWRLHSADVEIEVNELAPRGVELRGDPFVHFSQGVTAVISAPRPAATVTFDEARRARPRSRRRAGARHVVRPAGERRVPADAA